MQMVLLLGKTTLKPEKNLKCFCPIEVVQKRKNF